MSEALKDRSVEGCEPSGMTPSMGEQELARLGLVKMQDVLIARFVGREEATKMGFNHQNLTRIATAVSEITRNVIQHAGASGSVTFFRVCQEGRIGFKVVVQDGGRGIPETAAGDGADIASLGAGIPGTRCLMDELRIDSGSGRGTRVVMTKWLQSAGNESPH